jgi:hypothetical protein
MSPFIRILFVVIALLLVPPTIGAAQAVVDPSGHWEGSVQAMGMETAIVIDLARNAKGELVGTFGQPSEKLTGLPLVDFAIEKSSIRFQIKGKAGERAFAGEISADGTAIAGAFMMGGFEMPFTLKRMGDAKIETAAKNAPVGKELEGAWDATLDIRGTPVALKLTIANQPESGATAAVVNLDQGIEIPVSAITQAGASLTLEFKAIGASYAGAISKDGAELVGSFRQGTGSVPLTFHRAAK